MKLSTFVWVLTACLPLLGQAQEKDKEALRHCLATEQEGLSRFKNLEKRADELRGTEKLLLERRAILVKEKRAMDSNNTNPEQVAKYNEAISVFNAQSDRLNADKDKFETDFQAYENWMNTTLKPACNKDLAKPQ
ncbi:MAG: hypothetical protein KJ798_11010 [Gammaproteobacteria bacterium]|nr:hypothetical protein [Gammaproteobacteria bacterium]MBU0850131.1 hypothetical protein [Gammaproteobacteria bacterium]MBU1268619.1 hypothetical protein [Gammaproteobacteria bacterium]MBU1530043.1 hypothetical protein [Gammaproteobacteria bacterium]MBU1780898.1 hypothetical protein [Gammaproteobacteria bacterium]